MLTHNAVYVLYNENKGVLYSMIAAFIVEVAVMIVTLALVLPRLTVTPECLVTSAPTMFMAYWLASLAFEVFLFTLTVLKFAHSVPSTNRAQSVLLLFMRDGTWAFAMIFGETMNRSIRLVGDQDFEQLPWCSTCRCTWSSRRHLSASVPCES